MKTAVFESRCKQGLQRPDRRLQVVSQIQDCKIRSVGGRGAGGHVQEVQMTDNQPNQYLRLLQTHEIPKMLHDTRVNVMGHVGQDCQHC